MIQKIKIRARFGQKKHKPKLNEKTRYLNENLIQRGYIKIFLMQ